MPETRHENHSHDEGASAFARRLCERGLSEQWSLGSALNWDELDIESLGRPIRGAMASVYSQILHGEAISLAVTTRAVAAVPELWARLFGETQLLDEARHVAFFTRVVDALGTRMEPLPMLTNLGEDLRQCDGIEEQILGNQIVLESFAKAVFDEAARLAQQAHGRRIGLPGSEAASSLLEAIDRLVGADEARHLAFGTHYLRLRWPALSGREQRRLHRSVQRWSQGMLEIVAQMEKPLRTIWCDPERLRVRVVRAIRAQGTAIGLPAF